jgi:hypothetical protein
MSVNIASFLIGPRRRSLSVFGPAEEELIFITFNPR